MKKSQAQWSSPELHHYGSIAELTADTRATKESGSGDNCFGAPDPNSRAISCIG